MKTVMEIKDLNSKWDFMLGPVANQTTPRYIGRGRGEALFVSPVFHHASEIHEQTWAALEEEVIQSWLVPARREEQERQAELLEDQIRSVFGYGKKLEEFDQRLDRIDEMLQAILVKVAAIGSTKSSIMVPIQSLAPEPYKVLQPLTVVVTEADEGYEAAFFDASIFASGDTEEDAVSNLKDTMIDTYERLSELKESQLGPGPARQKQVLDFYIRKD
jgi:hypothetical protein